MTTLQPRPQRAKRATIKDVAQVAGVSVATVSNALNGRTAAMANDTLVRLQTAIHDLNFRPSGIARSLVTRRTSTIGIVLSEIETPLFLQALSAIEPIARANGFNVLMSNARDTDDERAVFELFVEREVDGIVFLSTSVYSEDSHFLSLQAFGIPTILVNRTSKHPGLNQINWDNAGGVEDAVKHLYRLGHRRIAYLRGPVDRHSTEERLRGFRAGLATCGLEHREAYERPGDYTASPRDWRQSTLALLVTSPRPTAIIAADDTVAAMAIKTAQRAGLGVPQDVAVVGTDDQPFCVYLNPSLTTIRLPVVDAGKWAVDRLLRCISEPSTAVEHVMLPCPLIVRESCGGGAKSSLTEGNDA